MIDSGTSHANAVVAGASALILEKRGNYTQLEIKASLLISADWKADSPATANDYDSRTAGVYDKMNQYGFGVLNIEKSLDYTNDDDFPNIIYEENSQHENFADKQYRITVDEVDEQVKVLLSWLIHPRGTIVNPLLPIDDTTNSTHPGIFNHQPFHNQIHDYDVNISNPDGTVIHTSDSDFQNNQFIVFNATQTGNYVITVSSNTVTRTDPLEPFVIASTHPLDKYPFERIITPLDSVVSFTDDFQGTLSSWTLSGPVNWVIAVPSTTLDNLQSDNTVLTSKSCNTQCTIMLDSRIDTSSPVTIEFSRFVAEPMEIHEGLFIRYSVDEINWTTLASYTGRNGQNTNVWTDTVLTLDTEHDSVVLQFLAKSTRANEVVAIDDISISPTSTVPIIPPIIPPTPHPITPITSFIESFQSTPTLWTLSGNNNWETGTPQPGLSGQPGNKVLTSNDCDSQCIISLNSNLDTASPLDITFDRFISRSIDSAEGLYVQYSTDDTRWTTLASYTENNRQDTGRWADTSLTLDITQSTASLRFVAESSYQGEFVEIDNVSISPRAADTTPPTITEPRDMTVEATALLTPVTIETPDVTDGTHPNPTITRTPTTTLFPVGVTTITWTATDSSGNSDTATQIITIQDTTPPAITKPTNKTFEATGEQTPLTSAQIGTATATDLVDSNPTVTSNIPQSFEFNVTATPITWTATDSYGNSDTVTQIITIRDTTSPTITAPADVSFTTTDTSIALTSADYGTATATDLVDPSPTITSNAPPSFRADHTTTITWTATDDYGNSAHAPQLVTVVHSSLRIFVPIDITVEATGPTMSVDIGTATATHDTDTNLTISNNATSTSFQVGTTTILWTVVDSIGVTVTDTQRITIQDTTPPVFGLVQDLDFVFEQGVPLIVNYDLPAATDIADDSVAVSCTPASGTIFNEDTTVVTCTAADDSGNAADATFNVSVRVFDPTIFLDDFEDGNMDGWTRTGDHELWNAMPLDELAYPPDHPSTNKVAQAVLCEVVCVMSMTDFDLSMQADAEFLQFYRYFDNTLDDGEYLLLEVYDGASWTELDRWSQENSDDDDTWHLEEYSLSSYTEVTDFGMRFTVYSDAFNEAVGIDDVRIFIVPEPVTAPTITPPDDVTAEATGLLTVVDIGDATATHDTDTNITILNDAPASFPLGSTTVTWTATSSSNKSATDTQRITVQDTTAPSVTAPPDASFTIIGTSIALTASDYGTATATDLVDSAPAIRNDAPSSFALGNTTITWTATDDYGNSATATQNVMVILSSLMITPPDDVTAEATGLLTVVDIGDATVTHDTDTNITILNDAPTSFPLGSTTVTWTATDSSSDVVTDTQRITVQDTTNPVFSSVTDLDFIFEPGVPLAINYDSPTATDSVDASVDVTCVPASGTVFSGGTTGVTCTATDNSGNTADITFNVDVLVLSTTVFLDDFEDGRLNGWTVTDYSDTWDSYTPEGGVNPPDHPSTNKIAQVSWCDITCTMSITGFDLSGNAYPEFLQFYRYVDDTLDNGEYLLLEVYDGSSWTELDRWTPEDSENDDAWHLEEYSLADYTEVTDFGMRFTTVLSSPNEVVGIDDVRIFIVP